MKKRRLRWLYLIIVSIGLLPALAFKYYIPGPPPLCAPIQNGLAFLSARNNPELGLLNESPIAAPHTYWLTNDNALAAYTLSLFNQNSLSATLKSSIQRYGRDTNGLIEVVWGVPIEYPPHLPDQKLVQQVGPDVIMQELRLTGSIYNDWAEYADLGFYAALNQFQRGNLEEARSIYSATMSMYDGKGMLDKAFIAEHKYSTYKLALALYVGSIIHAPIPPEKQIFETLLSLQTADGGFITHYDDQSIPDGDENTETTSFALLAFGTYGCTSY